MRRPFSVVAVAACAACAHSASAPAPANNPSRPAAAPAAPSSSIVVSSEMISAGSKESIAAWLAYATTRMLLIEAREPDPGHHILSADDYAIELAARQAMIHSWREERQKAAKPDGYLDGQVAIEDAHFLEEYVIAFASGPGWTVPPAAFAELDWPRYRAWAAANLAGHKLQRDANYEPPKGQPRPRPPGVGLPDPASLMPGQRPCSQVRSALDAAVAAWADEEKKLPAVALVAHSRDGFARVLEWAAANPAARERGVTWALPAVADLHFFAGFCANDREDWHAAVSHLEKAAALSPLEPKLRGELVHALTQQKRYDDAERAIATALAMKPGRCTEARLLRGRGFIQIERKQAVEAYQSYTRSLELDPSSELARREIKVILQMLQAAGGADAKALSGITPQSQPTTTTGGCRE